MLQTSEKSIFTRLPDALPVLQEYELGQKLVQWNLKTTLQLERFRVHRRLPVESDKALLMEFLQQEPVHEKWDVASLRFERLRVTVTSMAFFEKLYIAALVSRDGSIRGCMDDDVDGCMVSDLVTEMCANPTSDHCDVFSPDERQEFIYQLFAALVIGGGTLRQGETHLQEYEKVTRRLYRALVSVQKAGQGLEITSRVYRVDGPGLFPAPTSRFHSCFVILDARKRWVTRWYCPFRPSW